MSDWQDLYSEVKRRKMQAQNKKKIVKAVEKHGGLLILEGKYEKAHQIFDYIYAKDKKILEGDEISKILDWDLNKYNLIIIGCPGLDVPTKAFPKLREYVQSGGWLLTTDWVLTSIIDKVFPGYIAPSENRTEDAIVKCQILDPEHPFLDGAISAMEDIQWSDDFSKINEFEWWLEYRSFPIIVLRKDVVKVLIASEEIEEKWGEAPVLVEFNFAHGKVIHMISHAHLQKGHSKGRYISALIITNIMDEAVKQKISQPKKKAPKPAPQYVDDWESHLPMDTPSPELRLESPKKAPQYSSVWEEVKPEIRLESPKAAPSYTDNYERKPEIRLEAPKAAPSYTDNYERKPEIRLEAPKAAPSYTDNYERKPEIRLEAPKAAPQYTSDFISHMREKPSVPLEESWVATPIESPNVETFQTPKEMQSLSGTSMILEYDKKTLSLQDFCVFCLNDFNYYEDKVYKCKECGSLYHENCLNQQLDLGMCKKCDKMLLW